MDYAVIAKRLGVPRDKVGDVPAYMVEDEYMILAAEAAALPDNKKPTQDLIAQELAQ